jgi:hypothetical protein
VSGHFFLCNKQCKKSFQRLGYGAHFGIDYKVQQE